MSNSILTQSILKLQIRNQHQILIIKKNLRRGAFKVTYDRRTDGKNAKLIGSFLQNKLPKNRISLLFNFQIFKKKLTMIFLF